MAASAGMSRAATRRLKPRNMSSFLSSMERVLTAPGSSLDAALVVPRTIIVFLAAILYVRMAKKRFIAQASAIDLVMAIVFGSMLSRAINGSGTLASCLSAGLVLVVLQRVFERAARYSPRFER